MLKKISRLEPQGLNLFFLFFLDNMKNGCIFESELATQLLINNLKINKFIMSENGEKMLQILAERLGTTIEKLWFVMVSQAKYEIITCLIQMIIMFGFIAATVIVHVRFCKEKDGENTYDRYEGLAIYPMILASIISAILVIVFLSGFNELIWAMFNPEYWALRKILEIR